MYRIFLTGLALGPALVATLPLSAIAVTISGLGSVYALIASLRLHPVRFRKVTSNTKRTASLLQARLTDAQRKSLPNPAYITRELVRVLSVGNELQPFGAPPDRDTTIARTLQGFMHGWNVKDVAKLSKSQSSELYLINTLLRSNPGEAGRIAQLFARPETMLDLRDEIDVIALRRAAFDQDYNAFVATRDLWSRLASAPQSLNAQLQALGAPDIDLWHHIVMTHDMADKDQRSAALWCLQQQEVDRATVAGFFGRLTKEGTLRKALAEGDTDFLACIQGLIRAWNDSFYKHSCLSLRPAFNLITLKPLFDLELEHLRLQDGDTGWVAPHCLFVNYEGRAPRNRGLWDVKGNGLTQPPRQADYFETEAEPV